MLTAIKANATVPLISRLSDADELLPANGQKLLAKDIYASHIYHSLVQNKFPDTPDHGNEYTRPVLKI